MLQLHQSNTARQVNIGAVASASSLHATFEAWTDSSQDRYHLARRYDMPTRYATGRTWHAFMGYVGAYTLELTIGESRPNACECFKTWARAGVVDMQIAKCQNHSTFESRETQHMYEGFLGGLHARVAAEYAKASSPGATAEPDADNARLRQLLAAEQERSRILQAELSEWQRLRDIPVLHASLARGIPARLPHNCLLHLAGQFSDSEAVKALDYNSYRQGQAEGPLGIAPTGF